MSALVKEARQRRIAELLRSRKITSQAALATALAKAGEQVTQATLSRDLDELGALRVKEGHGRAVYRLPEEPSDTATHLQQMLNKFASVVTAAKELVVVRTPPGCAQVVARAIDNAELSGTLATIGGDDTVLVVPDASTTAKTLASRIQKLAASPINQGAN